MSVFAELPFYSGSELLAEAPEMCLRPLSLPGVSPYYPITPPLTLPPLDIGNPREIFAPTEL